MKINLRALTIEGLKNLMKTRGMEPYRADQLFQWLWQKNAQSFSSMTNISKSLRAEFTKEFTIDGLTNEKVVRTKDGVQKFLFRTLDNNEIETVFIPEQKRRTLCVSTQVGCPYNCRFCATGLMGFKRDLEAYEIADQIRLAQQNTGEKITNIVFMGMGEPLVNFEQVINAISIISSPIGLSISQRHTTISTAGINSGIRELLGSSLKVKLAISLNFANEKLRQEMMPVARNNPLKELILLAHEYSLKKSMVTFEYVLIDRINDRLEDARQLLKLIEGVPSKINLIVYNPHPRIPYKRPSVARVTRFYDFLMNSKHTLTLRKSRGSRIKAGCGQLTSPNTGNQVFIN
jgi:23S rRNA (adenine2503-C2)-methyltransferase